MWRWLVNLVISSMIFFPEKTFYERPQDYGFAWEDVSLRTADGAQLHGWFLKAPAEKAAILFFHGNAGNISNRLFKVKGWLDRGFSVLLLDYRGYGKSKGRIEREADVLQDATAAFKWLLEVKNIPLSKLILYGESLGTYPAVRLGAEREVAALILEAPFTSFFDLARIHYPFVPEMFLRDFEFPNEKYIAGAKAPVFILHGARDEICPSAMAEEIFEKAPEPKNFFSITNGGHNDLPMAAGEDFWERPYRFIQDHVK